MGCLLGLGIFLLPLIFAWFTLRRGHTTRARVIGFVWLVITLIAYGTATYGPGVDPAMASQSTVQASRGDLLIDEAR